MEQATKSAFAWQTAVQLSGPESAASPESPRLFCPLSLPETPAAQKLLAATSAPPVRRTRSMNSPPTAAHPVLVSAFAVAGTGAPDISQAPARLPTQRQLQLRPMFAFPLLPGPQEPSPFPFSTLKSDSASLLDKVNSLPGPKNILRSIIAERHNSLSLQDSSMLSDMLKRSTKLHTDTEGPAAASSASSANSQAGVSDDTARPSRSSAKALPLKVGVIPLHRLEDLTHSAASPTASSYLISSRSAFDKSRLQTHKRVRVVNNVASASDANSHKGMLQQGAFVPSMLPANSVVMYTGGAGPKATSPALPFLGQLVPALPCKGADSVLPGNAQGHCHNSGTVPEGPTGHATYTGPLAASLEIAHGPLQNSPNGCCFSPHQHQHVPPANRLQKQASRDRPVQKRRSMSPISSKTHSTHTGFRAMPSSRNKQQQLRSANKGSRAASQIFTGVFQTPAPGCQVTTAGPSFPLAHNPYFRAVSSCPKGHSKLPFPTGLTEAGSTNGNLWSPAQAVQLEKSRAALNSLECRLVLPHGSRSHKRPKLEDRLKERNLMVAKHLLEAQASDTPTNHSHVWS
ncbi:TPA: hypothetical protein ACH3X1_008228 [Trebouxia sp. C0004]